MNFTAPKLLVSIVVYNPHLEDLGSALKSVLSSSVPLQVVIIDNSELPLPTDFLKKFPKVSYIKSSQNVGYGRGHNLAINSSHNCPYHLVLNPDVYFEPELLSKLLKHLESDPRIGLAIPGLRYPDGRHQPVNRRLPRVCDYIISFLSKTLNTNIFQDETYKRYHLSDIDLTRPFICPVISGCFMLFRTSALKSVDGFDERFFLYFEDTDLARRVAQKHLTVVFPELVAYHQWNRGAYKNFKLFSLFLRSLIKYFNKWGWFVDKEKTRLNSSVKSYLAP